MNDEIFICGYCKQASRNTKGNYSCENPGCDHNPDMAEADISERNRRYAVERAAQAVRNRITRIRNKYS